MGVWLVTYVVALTLYSIVLVPMPGSWEELDGPVLAWFPVFLGYAALALAVWGYFAITNRRPRQR